MSNPIIISIEGNIGSGKTTFISDIETLLASNPKIANKKICILKEPVDLWTKVTDESGASILENFYKNPKKWAFAFQMLALSTRMSQIQKAIAEYPDADILLCERSLECDGYVFAKMLYDDGMIDYLSYNIYKTMYDSFISQFSAQHILYLSVGPELCKERIVKRGRHGEDGIQLDYLEKCHKYHSDWLKAEHIQNVRDLSDDFIKTFYDSNVEQKIGMLEELF